MHVRSIDFLGVRENADRVIGRVRKPADTVELSEHIGAIRIGFDAPFANSGPTAPTVAGINDTNFAKHNIQIRLPQEMIRQFGVAYVAGKLVVEDAQTVRIDISRGTRLVNADGNWPMNIKVTCEIFLRGTMDAANNFPELADTAGQGLDGEPKPPSGGVISGNGSPGGDFTTTFSLLITNG